MATDAHDDRMSWLSILRHNSGFEDPERWLEFARTHGFKRVRSTKLVACPDCGSSASRKIGQQIYYSTLMSLLACRSCGLVYADTRIDPEVLRGHFERAYKDEAYFSDQRRLIFQHISSIVQERAPSGASVIDIGGAEGHLLSTIHGVRPDLDLTLNDVSSAACAYGAEKFGLRTACAPVAELAALERTFDVLLLIDVIYYEPDLCGLWEAVGSLLDKQTCLILRVPNKFALLSRLERLRAVLATAKQRSMFASIALFNPEHIYVFTRPYLLQKLRRLGFTSIEFLPSPPLNRRGWANGVTGTYYRAARVAHGLSGGSLVATPAMVVVAAR